jgi:threonine dehydratase
MNKYVSLNDIKSASDRIAGIIRPTPLIYSQSISDIVGSEVWLKLETLQTTGSFKIRGASNRMLQLTEEEKACGVVAVSSGNHGRAVAYIAQKMGIRSIICVCNLVPENKRQAMIDYGADLRIVGHTQDDAQEYADKLIAEEGLTWVAPYDDLSVIAGQATIALEALTDLPDADTIIAPLSGGGLLSGIILGSKLMSSDIEVIGVSMEVEPGMVRSLEAGKPVTVEEPSSLADSLGGSIGLNNQYTFPIVRDFMDRAILVAEDSLAPAMNLLFEAEGVVMEGGSASALAGVLSPEFKTGKQRKIIVVISGRNIAKERFLEAISGVGGK